MEPRHTTTVSASSQRYSWIRPPESRPNISANSSFTFGMSRGVKLLVMGEVANFRNASGPTIAPIEMDRRGSVPGARFVRGRNLSTSSDPGHPLFHRMGEDEAIHTMTK